MLYNIKSFYIIGIGGISLSAIAKFLKNKGYFVCGSDITDSQLIEELRKNNIEVEIGNSPKFVQKSDALIISGAIGEDNEDLILARSLNKPIFSRAEILGLITADYKVISVAGTHGKTTTTGMLASILLNSHIDPNIHIGGILNNINSNLHIGKSDIFLTEACEYKDSFLTLKNYISIVLNVQEDHLDYFGNIDNIFNSFNKFVKNTSKNGVIIYNFDQKDERLHFGSKNHIGFGINGEGDVQGRNVNEYQDGKFEFDLFFKDKKIEHIKLNNFGMHNVYNALAASSAALFLGIDSKFIKDGIKNFKGVKRRFEIISENPLIIHDYAHHPTEITATLKACREIKKAGKIICIFQPHTYSRTRDLFDDFVKCFSLADEVWLLPIYPAREKAIRGITSKRLAKEISKNGQKCRYFSSFSECKEQLLKKEQFDLCAILGAGDIEKLAYSLKE